jgi:hypothetical protein
MCLAQMSGEWHDIFAWDPPGARGTNGENLSTTSGALGETIAKHDILM